MPRSWHHWDTSKISSGRSLVSNYLVLGSALLVFFLLSRASHSLKLIRVFGLTTWARQWCANICNPLWWTRCDGLGCKYCQSSNCMIVLIYELTLYVYLQWALCGVFIMCIACVVAELGSAAPTAGGFYYWTHRYAPPRMKNVLSWIVGCQPTSPH